MRQLHLQFIRDAFRSESKVDGFGGSLHSPVLALSFASKRGEVSATLEKAQNSEHAFRCMRFLIANKRCPGINDPGDDKMNLVCRKMLLKWRSGALAAAKVERTSMNVSPQSTSF